MSKQKIKKFLNSINEVMQAIYFNSVCKILVYIFAKRDIEKKKYSVSLCLIFKDEAPFLKEWIDFHKVIGIDHFYLYNNNSTDKYEEVIQPYVDSGVITLIDWPYQQAQIEAYKHCYENYRNESNWISFLDADEFICLKYKDNIADWLADYSRYPSIAVQWRIFGTGGILQHDFSRSVIEQYHICWDRFYKYGKCFVNTKYDIANFDTWYLHHLTYTYFKLGRLKIKLPPIDQFRHFCFVKKLNNSISDELNKSSIQINHYFTKSWSVYSSKRQKTDVLFAENPKEKCSHFEKFEMKCISTDFTIYRFLIRLKIFRKEIEY
jgi:hypothetical protein